MISIAKVYNLSVPNPEPRLLSAAEGTKVKYGAALVLKDGELRPPMPGDCPEYLCGCNKTKDCGLVMVYPVSSQTLLHAQLLRDYDRARVGDNVSLCIEDGVADKVVLDPEGCGKIIDLSEIGGYAFISFNK